MMVRLVAYQQPRALTEFRSQFTQLLDQLFGRDVAGDGGEITTWFSPSADIAETDQEFRIALELPGLRPEDVNIEIDNGNLWVSGERQEDREESGQTWHRVERQFGQFRRVFTLGTKIEPDQVDAEFRNGVLRVVVKKIEPSKRRIEVRESQAEREKVVGARAESSETIGDAARAPISMEQGESRVEAEQMPETIAEQGETSMRR